MVLDEFPGGGASIGTPNDAERRANSNTCDRGSSTSENDLAAWRYQYTDPLGGQTLWVTRSGVTLGFIWLLVV